MALLQLGLRIATNLPMALVLLAGPLRSPSGSARMLLGQTPQLVGRNNLEQVAKLMAADDYAHAAGLLAREVEADPQNARAYTMLAYCDLRLNQPGKSLREYTKAAAIEHPSSADLQNVAKDYALLGDIASADHWMIAAVKLDPKDADAWYGLGRVRFTEQRFQEAVECFKRSLIYAPRSEKTENNLGLAFEGLNRVDDAAAAYRQAIAWQQNDPHRSEQPLLNLGILLVHQGKLEEATALLTQAVQIAPRDPRSREQLGQLYLQQGQLVKAQEQLEAATALDPKKSSLHFLLGRVYHQQGHEDRAKSEFALAASLTGTHSTPEPF